MKNHTTLLDEIEQLTVKLGGISISKGRIPRTERWKRLKHLWIDIYIMGTAYEFPCVSEIALKCSILHSPIPAGLTSEVQRLVNLVIEGLHNDPTCYLALIPPDEDPVNYILDKIYQTFGRSIPWVCSDYLLSLAVLELIFHGKKESPFILDEELFIPPKPLIEYYLLYDRIYRYTLDYRGAVKKLIPEAKRWTPAEFADYKRVLHHVSEKYEYDYESDMNEFNSLICTMIFYSYCTTPFEVKHLPLKLLKAIFPRDTENQVLFLMADAIQACGFAKGGYINGEDMKTITESSLYKALVQIAMESKNMRLKKAIYELSALNKWTWTWAPDDIFL